MFSLLITLYDGRNYIFPIFKNFQQKYIDSTGSVTSDGIKYITEKFYFLNQIQKTEVYCNDFKTFFMMFGHKHSIREALTIYTNTKSKKLIDSSRIFNHTHIGTYNYLTPDGVKLVFGSECDEQAWISITNYEIVFNEYYEYCKGYDSQPPTHKPSGFGFGISFGTGTGDFCSFTSCEPLFSTPPQKKHKADEELICPDAPKKVRK